MRVFLEQALHQAPPDALIHGPGPSGLNLGEQLQWVIVIVLSTLWLRSLMLETIFRAPREMQGCGDAAEEIKERQPLVQADHSSGETAEKLTVRRAAEPRQDAPGATPPKESKKTRIRVFDNARFVLIAAVIWEHTVCQDLNENLKHPALWSAFAFLATFHMDCFYFASGLMANVHSATWYRSTLLLLPMVFFLTNGCVYQADKLAFCVQGKGSCGAFLVDAVTVSARHMWFMAALIHYRILWTALYYAFRPAARACAAWLRRRSSAEGLSEGHGSGFLLRVALTPAPSTAFFLAIFLLYPLFLVVVLPRVTGRGPAVWHSESLFLGKFFYFLLGQAARVAATENAGGGAKGYFGCVGWFVRRVSTPAEAEEKLRSATTGTSASASSATSTFFRTYWLQLAFFVVWASWATYGALFAGYTRAYWVFRLSNIMELLKVGPHAGVGLQYLECFRLLCLLKLPAVLAFFLWCPRAPLPFISDAGARSLEGYVYNVLFVGVLQPALLGPTDVHNQFSVLSQGGALLLTAFLSLMLMSASFKNANGWLTDPPCVAPLWAACARYAQLLWESTSEDKASVTMEKDVAKAHAAVESGETSTDAEIMRAG